MNICIDAKYLVDGLDLTKVEGGYEVFTIQTQHFEITGLCDLTNSRFEQAINDYRNRIISEDKMIDLMFEEDLTSGK